MQTWAKRGLQTALVTGGLLMLGTGIASADEDVNPDRPASPIDGSIGVPVHLQNNAVGTPLGSRTLPDVHRDATIRPSDVTTALPTGKVTPVTDAAVTKAKRTATGVAAPAVDKVRDEATSGTSAARDQAAPLLDRAKHVTDRAASLPGGDKLANVPSIDDKVTAPALDAHGEPVSGNQINADLVIPFDVSGNAIAVLGKAETTNESAQAYGWDHDAETSGRGGFISGNVADADWALPVQVTNNAVAAVGRASASGTSSQEAWSTGDIVTDGSHGALSGNVVAPQGATPVQINGNGIAGAGVADACSQADTSAESGGSVLTSGADSAGSGNAAPVPVAVPVKANGNAIMVLGRATAEAESTADAQAGATRTGMYGVPTYVETNGYKALAAGNIAQPAASGPVSLCGNAGGVDGFADATCDTASETVAGGTSRSTGASSVASGGIASAPVALPASGFGNTPVALGTAIADATNTNNATAGGDTYTRGHDSVLSGTTANTSPAGPIDVYANPIVAVGKAATTNENTATTTSGGNTGTTGDNSAGGGNMATVPVAVPGEAYGNMVAGGGGATTSLTEEKNVNSGGVSNTADDHGLVASNLVNAPVATAVQAFGNGVGALAFTHATGTSDDEVTAGGPSKATGVAGLGSGNIAQTPVSQPFQFFGNGASVLAKGEQVAINELDSTAGGDATSNGAHSAVGGNVASVPVGGAGQVYGETVAALGLNDAVAGSETESEAGGDTTTSGEHGLISGNVASPQAMPVAQSFATAVSGVGGKSSALGTNQSDIDSGGDIDTNGDSGVLSGNLADVPAAAVAQPFGDAVAVVGSKSKSMGLGDTEGDVGGTSTTSGAGLDSLSGMDLTQPVGADVPIYNVPFEVIARAITESADNSAVKVGEGEPQLYMPVDHGIAPTEVPTFMRGARSVDPAQGAISGVLGGFADGMPAQPQVGDVNGLAPQGVLAQAPVAVPAASRSEVTNPLGEASDLVSLGVLAQTPVAVPAASRSEVTNPLGEASDLVPQGVLAQAPVAVPAASRSEVTNPLGGLFGGIGLPVNLVAGQRDLPQNPAMPDLGYVLSPLAAVQPAHFGRGHTATPLNGTPQAGDLGNIMGVFPTVPADATTVLPVIPGVPVEADADLPVVRAPGVPEVSPRVEPSTLDSTRAALANLFTANPIR
jgi:trimeric autotransporter adhesin